MYEVIRIFEDGSRRSLFAEFDLRKVKKFLLEVDPTWKICVAEDGVDLPGGRCALDGKLIQ